MKKIARNVVCALLSVSFFCLAGCDLLGESTSGDTQTGNGNHEPLVPVLPVIPDAPEEEIIVLPETLDFSPRSVVSQYGYRYFADMEKGEMYCRFYYDLYNACCALADDKTIIPTKQTVEDSTGKTEEIELYIVKTLDFGKYGITQSEALSVWKTFRMEYPEFYWMDNEVSYGEKTLNVQIFEEYALGSVRVALQEKIEAMANECHSYLSDDMTATELALTIYDYVITSTQYAYKNDGKTPEDVIWAHNLVGLAEYGKGVCETYAKAFEYLCELVGISAITVGGIAGMTKAEVGGHAWNVVKLDGVWYCVDPTWGDQKTLYRKYFGQGVTEFYETHTPDKATVSFGSTWQYELPTLSEKTLSPVHMYKKDGEGKMYGCIDYAFADITDEAGEYTITLHPNTSVTATKKTEIYLSEVVFATGALPKASLIKFVGKSKGITPLDMRSKNTATLWSNIYLQDICWTYPALVKNGYDIETSLFSSYKEEEKFV